VTLVARPPNRSRGAIPSFSQPKELGKSQPTTASCSTIHTSAIVATVRSSAITNAIIHGTQPVGLDLARLHASPIPLGWDAQAATLGA